MALMKIGRKGDSPIKKKGEDPKKKAAVQEVTVSAKKPDTKDQKVQLEGATTSNIFYADIKDPIERSKAAQKYENANYDKALKSGNMVTLSSIKTSNPKSYELLSNSMQSKKDAYGEIEDYLVDKKYANVSSYKDIYGYDYDPVERKKAVKEDKLDAFEKKMGGRTQYIPKSDFSYNIKYMTDEKLKDKFDKDPGKLPIKSAFMSTKGGSIIERKATEKDNPEDWSIKKPSRFSGTTISYSAPSLNRSKAVKGEDNVKFGGGVKTDSGRFGVKKLAYAAVANPLQRSRFNKEVRQGKAYFGSNDGSTSGDLATKRSSLKSDKAGLKTAIKEVRKDKALPSSLTKSERIKGYRAEIGNLNKDLRTTNKASRYLKDLGQPSANTKITEYKTSAGDVKTINTGKIQYATPEKFKGYLDSPQNKRVDKLADLKLKPDAIKSQIKISRKSNNRLRK